MSIQRTILQRLNESHAESRRIDESWPPVLNKIRNKVTKDEIRNTLNRAGIDIENTPYQEVVITNGRDPRLKGKNVVIFELGGDQLAVWFMGKFIVNEYIFPEHQYVSKLSWTKILQYSKRITSIEFDQKTAEELAKKKAERAEAKKGMEMRYTKATKPKWAKIDKSGYVLNPNKYKDMLASMNVENGVKVLQDAKDIYVRVSQNIDQIDWDMDNRDIFDSYQYVMTTIPRRFADLSKALKAYEDAKTKYAGNVDASWYIKTSRDNVKTYIKELKDVIAKAKKYL